MVRFAQLDAMRLWVSAMGPLKQTWHICNSHFRQTWTGNELCLFPLAQCIFQTRLTFCFLKASWNMSREYIKIVSFEVVVSPCDRKSDCKTTTITKTKTSEAKQDKNQPFFTLSFVVFPCLSYFCFLLLLTLRFLTCDLLFWVWGFCIWLCYSCTVEWT